MEFTGWLCASAGNYSTNQMIAFQTRAASLIRTIDPARPITSDNAVALSSAWHLAKKPAWVAGGPDQTPDTKADLTEYLSYITQGIDLMELHFYNFRVGTIRDNNRFCPGPDCIAGDYNAGLLDVYSAVAASLGKRLHIGEYADYDPFLKDLKPGFGLFVKNILDKTVALPVPYSAPWSFEFYQSRTSTYSSKPSFHNIEPGYTDQLIEYIRQTNIALGSSSVPPSISIPFVHAVLTNPLNGAVFTGTSTLLYAVASAPRVGAFISNVQFMVDGARVATVTAPPYSFVLAHTALAPGTHTIKVIATDTADHTEESNSATVTCNASVCTVL